MKPSKVKRDGVETITVGGELDFACAEELRKVLMDALSAADQTNLDIEGATGADLSCLQLLCSAHRTAARMNKTFSLSGDCPEPVRNAVRSAGFARLTGCPRDINKNCIWIGI